MFTTCNGLYNDPFSVVHLATAFASLQPIEDQVNMIA